METAVEDQRYRAVLRALGDAVERSEADLNSALAKLPDPWPDEATIEHGAMLIDDHGELVEAALGSCFIVAQTYITAVVSRVVEAAKFASSEGMPVSPSLTKKDDALDTGVRHGSTGLTYVRAVWSLANYFKHRDEWTDPYDWTALTGLAAKTATAVAAIGLAAGNTNNLRIGADALGMTPHNNVIALADGIDAWARNLVALLP